MNLNKLNELRLEMIEAKVKFDREAKNYAMDNCGINIGDIIEVTGYSHYGKKMEVYKVGIKYDNWHGEYFACLYGSVLKNDGTISKNSAESTVSLGKIKK